MAEVATMVVGPLLSMVTKKASSHLLDQYQVMEGMEEQHEVLKRKLPAILDVITNDEEQAAKHREGAKAWLEAVRKVAYKANDVLDEFKYEALRHKAKAEGHYKALGMDVIKLFPSHNRVVFRCKMAKRLCVILHKIEVLIAEMNAFGFKFKPQPPLPMKWRQTDASIPTDCLDIASESRAQEKKELVGRLLARASSKDLMVLPIIRMGGLGKTTLAQLVYNDPQIQKHFELCLWVCVSDDFDVDSLANRIVKEIGCAANGSSALDRLQNAVSGKRYLLILDDVWNRDEPSKWERLKSCLQHGGSGSSVLTTTRDEAVAKLMMGKSTTDAQNLKNLDEVYIREIIGTRAFGSKQEKEWPHELVCIVGDMVKRCSGSPLAATALGSVLRTKTSKQEWEDVLSRSTICDEENGILPVLKLSYNCLPSYMRQCFAFCAMFPKDYEIDVEMLIHLWMANGFIPDKPKVCPETIGERIFNELKSRSFFQDLKSVPFVDKNYSIYKEDSKHRYCSRITCKIHDLMHDVAQSAMGEECAAIATHPSKREDVPRSVRHLYLSIRRPNNLLNASQEKGSPTFQTLFCDRYVEDIKILSKYNSIRALKICVNHGSILRPKYLHHLRYLNLSGSKIEALPGDISILYHLQTLNLSHCHSLVQLPKGLKYLTALHHLYTHICPKLESMPAEIGHLTSLQTLTYFVAGTDSGCSNLGELQNLDLGGTLELSQLENVKGPDAQAAGLGNKKKLIELELRWTDSDQEAQNNKHKEVVEGLKPHDGLKVLSIYCCGSITFPMWMNTLRCMVELKICGCKKVEKLPALWELRALQVLHLKRLESLHCLCSGGKTPVTFPELKVLFLYKIPKFDAWFGTDEIQGEGPIFPKVEELSINWCRKLTALPKAASVIMESSRGVDTKCRSAFPALRKMELCNLTLFERWEAVEGTLDEEVAFPQLEELSVVSCGSLSALPKGSLLAKQPFGGVETVCCRSAFPALRKMTLKELTVFERWEAVEGIAGEEVIFPQLEELYISFCTSLSALPKVSLLAKQSFGEAETVCHHSAFPALRKLHLACLPEFERWGAVEGTHGEEVPFPLLEILEITHCSELTDLPEAPKLRELHIVGDYQKISRQAASRCIPSLSSLTLDASPRFIQRFLNRKLPLPAMRLAGCSLLFSSHSSARVIWTCFAQLVHLEIWDCHALHYWPDNVFQPLVCLRNLSIVYCSKLTGRTQASDEQPAPAPERGVLLPCLEFLEISNCKSLVEVPNLPASLKTLLIVSCSDDIKSIVFTQQEDTFSSIPGSRISETTASTAVLKLPSAANHPFLPFSCLESLIIQSCDHLSEVVNLPSSIKTLYISGCVNLQSLSGQLDAVQKLRIDSCSKLKSLEPCLGGLQLLEELTLRWCKRLVSLPDGPQAYSSLRVLWIMSCNGIKLLPLSLQNQLDCLQEKYLDAHYKEPTWKRSIRKLVCSK